MSKKSEEDYGKLAEAVLRSAMAMEAMAKEIRELRLRTTAPCTCVHYHYPYTQYPYTVWTGTSVTSSIGGTVTYSNEVAK